MGDGEKDLSTSTRLWGRLVRVPSCRGKSLDQKSGGLGPFHPCLGYQFQTRLPGLTSPLPAPLGARGRAGSHGDTPARPPPRLFPEPHILKG